MKVVIGLDEFLPSRQAVDLFLELGFPACDTLLAYVIESMLPDGSFTDLSADHPIGKMMREAAAIGRDVLDQSRCRFQDRGLDCRTDLLYGPPGKVLLDTASRESADLIVVGCNRRSALDDLLLGSTARALLHEAPQHLLIGRQPVGRAGGLNAVLAIDQRDNADNIVSELLQLHPEALGRIDILTVNSFGCSDLGNLDKLPAPLAEVEGWISEGLEEKNECLARVLSQLGADCRPVVVEGEDPAHAITIAADQAQADLIIIGAERHGFLDRHVRRCVSEGLLANDKRSLLVLRPKQRK